MSTIAGPGSRVGSRPFVLLLLVAIVPLLVFGAILTQWYAAREQSDFDRQLERAASRTATAVSRELQAQLDLLGIVAESPRLDFPLQQTAFAEIAERLRLRVPAWSSIRVSDPSGTLVLTSPVVENTLGTKVVDLDSHKRVAETGLPVLGNMVRGPRGNAGFAVRVPVIRRGETVYIVSALLRPALLTASLASTSLPPGWTSWIVDDRDQIIAATSPDVPELAPFTGASSEPTGIQSTWSEPLRIVSEQLTTSPWRVVVAMPEADFTKPQTASTTLLIVSTLAVLGLGWITAVLFRREIKARQAQDAAVADWQRLDALSKLAGGLAHDFNNLMMGIQGGIEQLRRRRSDEERFNKVTGMILESVERGKTTTQRLLGFSRRSNTGSEVIRLQDRSKELLELLEQGVRENTAVVLDIDPEAFPVRIDSGALEVALVNIASNAQDAMPEGGRLSVTVRNVENGADLAPQLRGPHLVITASDTGMGIAPEYINRIFDPFFTTKGPAVSGLGLSQVYGFAARSGGVALANSVPGSGTMITLAFPKSNEPAQTKAQVGQQAGPRNQSCLVVDDEPSVAQAVAAMLEGAGHTVDTASSAAAGMELLARLGYDLLVTDITMPGMSGLDFALAARRRFPQLSVILMSGYSTQRERGAKHPFPLLSKPFTREDLLSHLADAAQLQADRSNVVSIEEGRRN